MPAVIRVRIDAVRDAAQRRLPGYVEDVLKSASRQDGVHAWLDKAEYERIASEYHIHGAGAELKTLLAAMGMRPAKGCKCERRARHMDRMGCDWCEQNVPTIVGWLQEEHARQKLLVPFISLAAEQLVRLAIRRARKKGIK